jgi:hypothetical protein
MDKRFTYTAFFTIAVFLFSCKNEQSRSHGPIVLGDSSIIVTETDPQRLQDLVADLKPVITSSEPKDTEETAGKTPVKGKAPDSTKKVAVPVAAKQPAPAATAAPATFSGPGLKADFNIMSLLITNVAAKQSGNPNLTHANGAVYTLQSGTINGNLIKVTPNVTKVSQRYQSVVVLKNELGVLPLESLTTTTDWEPLKGINNIYRIAGLDEKSLEYPEVHRNEIHTAVGKAAKRHRFSRKKVQDWENSVRNVKSVNQKPLFVTLRSVMWKIDGKDASGKIFSKQIRIDIPL